MKKKLFIASKLLITGLVFWWVIYKLGPGGLHDLWMNVRMAHWSGLLLAGLFFIIILGLGIYRWQLLLRVQGIQLSYYHTAWMVAVGMFFNAFLIGATGGDVPKAWYAAEAAADRKTQAIFSSVVDRFIGLLGLFILATISVLIYLPVLLGDEKTRIIAISIIVSLVIAVLGIGLTTQRHHLTSKPWWKSIWHYVPGKEILCKLSESYNLYGKYPGTLLIALILSLGVHVSSVFVAWSVGRAIEIKGVSLLHYFVYCPMINAFSAIPITVGGLGLREGAFKFFFSLQSVPDAQAVALSLLVYAGTLVISLVCGIFYLVGKPTRDL